MHRLVDFAPALSVIFVKEGVLNAQTAVTIAARAIACKIRNVESTIVIVHKVWQGRKDGRGPESKVEVFFPFLQKSCFSGPIVITLSLWT